jgi:hypothetical protein
VTSTTVATIGYLASALVVLSLLMTSVLRLRIIGLAGALVFAGYGVLIGALPIVVTNATIMVVHSVHLVRLLRDRAAASYFEVVRWPTDGVYLPRFLTFHATDIARTQPAFTGLSDAHLAWVILRDAVPVGVLLARRDRDGSAELDLDYVTPPHRDFAPGSAVFSRPEIFRAEGIDRILTRADTDVHGRYLARMGFTPLDSTPGTWCLEVG